MEFDAVVIGSGAGGGAAAWSLATSGIRTLLVEAKPSIAPQGLYHDEEAIHFDRLGSYNEKFDLNGQLMKPMVGSGPGGSSALYGAVLLRASKEDFRPGKHYHQYLSKNLWDWPFNEDDLKPYYKRVEDLLKVSGDFQQKPKHLIPRDIPYKRVSPPLSTYNRYIKNTLQGHGLSCFQLPLAIDFDRCHFCEKCPGYMCPYDAKRTSWNEFVSRGQEKGLLEVKTGFVADKFEFQGRRAVGVILRGMQDGKPIQVKAKNFVVACGASQTPLLLQRSQVSDQSDMIGRNLMYHLGAVVVGLYGQEVHEKSFFTKSIGSTEFYLGTKEFPHKMGYVQSIPVPGEKSVKENLPTRLLSQLAPWIAKRSMVFALSIEDLPQPQNKIWQNKSGKIQVHHSFHNYDIFRASHGLKLLKKYIKKTKPILTTGFLAHNKLDHLAHQVGTARAGVSPRDSVVNRDCRMHLVDNLFVADGSVFPTSLGVGPALTIMANALRVADRIKESYI